MLTFQLIDVFGYIDHGLHRRGDDLVTRIVLVMVVQYVLQHTHTPQQMKIINK